jgi:2-octaprenylphenol hydroxylase
VTQGAIADVDVLVVGGGPVGACCAALLLREGGYAPARIALIEPGRPAALAATGDVDLRVSAFSRASERILGAAGAWETILAGRHGVYERMRVWHARDRFTSTAGLTFDAADIAEPNLGWIIENRAVQHALLAAVERAGARILAQPVQALEAASDHLRVITADGAIHARLVVGADGSHSRVRELAGLAVDAKSYGQSAIVCVVRTGRAHAATAWQRFLRPGTVAFLPLPDGSSSIVWSIPTEAAERLAAAPVPTFERELAAALDHALGEVTLVGDRGVFALQRATAQRYVIERCALIGDAAHVVHPLAGQGVNLGLLDAAALAEVLGAARREGEDPGALRVLRRYERWRRSENQLMSISLDAMNRVLASGSGPVSRLAARGLALVDRSAPLKRLFMARALGISGELPRAARVQSALRA